ncbi:MAG: hypothetical protein NVS1B12_04330 [Acidimicrobiales bacterium]
MSQVNDDVTASLTDLSAAIDQNANDEKLLARRIRGLADAHAAGASWSSALADEPSPGALTLSARILSRFSTASGALRRGLAVALRREGMTVPAIASAFGVSHQRVSVLLNRSGSESIDGGRR